MMVAVVPDRAGHQPGEGVGQLEAQGGTEGQAPTRPNPGPRRPAPRWSAAPARTPPAPRTTARSSRVDHRSSTPLNSWTIRTTPTRAPTPMPTEPHETRCTSARAGSSTPAAAAPARRSSASRPLWRCAASRVRGSRAAGWRWASTRARRSGPMVRRTAATAGSTPAATAAVTRASARSRSSHSSGAPDAPRRRSLRPTTATPAPTGRGPQRGVGRPDPVACRLGTRAAHHHVGRVHRSVGDAGLAQAIHGREQGVEGGGGQVVGAEVSHLPARGRMGHEHGVAGLGALARHHHLAGAGAGAGGQQGEIGLVLHLLQAVHGQARAGVSVPGEAPRPAQGLGIGGIASVEGDLDRAPAPVRAHVAGHTPLLVRGQRHPGQVGAQIGDRPDHVVRGGQAGRGAQGQVDDGGHGPPDQQAGHHVEGQARAVEHARHRPGHQQHPDQAVQRPGSGRAGPPRRWRRPRPAGPAGSRWTPRPGGRRRDGRPRCRWSPPAGRTAPSCPARRRRPPPGRDSASTAGPARPAPR